MAILDMAWRINPDVRVFNRRHTAVWPQETYDLIDKVASIMGWRWRPTFPDTREVEGWSAAPCV